MFWIQRESQIDHLIDLMDGGAFQLLAEDYLQLRYPGLFSHLDPLGRRTDGKPIRGSPDFIGRTSDGAFAPGEASKQDNWKRWLIVDLQVWSERKKSGEIRRFGGFYAVSWHERKSVDEQKLDEIYQIAKQYLKLEPRDVVVIFRKELVRDLAQPQFVQIVRKHLDLPFTIYPFVHVDEAPLESPEFAPKREEFESGTVRVPENLVYLIDLTLRSNREALVLGEPASGKTVLGLFYGFRHLGPLRPVFYLDCDKFQKDLPAVVTSQILSVIETWRSRELLLVIDNVHLTSFKSLRLELRKQQTLRANVPTSDAFSVLYLGRRVAELSKATPQLKPVYTKADPGIFRAVYTRLALRHNVAPPSLADSVFKRWAEEFAGDLITFSVAANSCGRQLASPETNIDTSLALDSVRGRYLKPLQDDRLSYRNFLILCALAELEIRAPRDAFETVTPLASPFGPMIEQGVVYEERGPKDSVSYSLPHPNLGSLIVRAAPDAPTPADLLKEACRRCPSLTDRVLLQMRAKER